MQWRNFVVNPVCQTGNTNMCFISAQWISVHSIPSTVVLGTLTMMGDIYNSASQLILHVPIFPYLWTAHCLVMCRAVRASTGESKLWRFHKWIFLPCRKTGISSKESIVFISGFYNLHIPWGHLIAVSGGKASLDISYKYLEFWKLRANLVPDELHETQHHHQTQHSDTATSDRSRLDETKYISLLLLLIFT